MSKILTSDLESINRNMTLYFNGCSHTWGDDLADPATQSWPAVLSQQLGCNFVNDSQSGGTNDRIKYRTVKNIESEFYDNKLLLKIYQNL